VPKDLKVVLVIQFRDQQDKEVRQELVEIKDRQHLQVLRVLREQKVQKVIKVLRVTHQLVLKDQKHREETLVLLVLPLRVQ
jgi:hypothetical protein